MAYNSFESTIEQTTETMPLAYNMKRIEKQVILVSLSMTFTQTANGKYNCFSILFMLSSNKSYKIEVSLTIHCKYKYFDSTVHRAEDRRQKLYSCRLP